MAGSFDGTSNTELFIADADIPTNPSYGDAKLTGLKLGLYIMSSAL